MLDGVQDSIAFSPCQAVLTSFVSDIDMTATMPVGTNTQYPKHPPRHWMVINVGGGNLSYKDNFGNTISAMDCTQLVGVLLPAGRTVLASGTTITKLLVIW